LGSGGGWTGGVGSRGGCTGRADVTVETVESTVLTTVSTALSTAVSTAVVAVVTVVVAVVAAAGTELWIVVDAAGLVGPTALPAAGASCPPAAETPRRATWCERTV
jgi:hypothetical protein